ncbi:hypothetical protein ACUXCC_001505 [Cytobacillus horneckiae]|uniref:hypothetical protein n=1 Tax=Cytobacillus horneckiae TaxID=549687 RepID=UPI000AB0D351|nr:hypothetical protein [Cytobacillus horneckiae]MBN6885730.1 hypothetical protein [Cytobacillus horneckiae]MCM3177277.1 hypothetical protein [Cytobacillus horneckiae]MEC1156161.1 hypothetical protein [Cytobacillus horneckiae]MED2937520.1 hypothetical protein [Cytobacillus horneckiae]
MEEAKWLPQTFIDAKLVVINADGQEIELGIADLLNMDGLKMYDAETGDEIFEDGVVYE